MRLVPAVEDEAILPPDDEDDPPAPIFEAYRLFEAWPDENGPVGTPDGMDVLELALPPELLELDVIVNA